VESERLPRSGKMSRDRLKTAISRLGSEHTPSPGWELRVLDKTLSSQRDVDRELWCFVLLCVFSVVVVIVAGLLL
jgi:hypothetical protein